MNVPCCAYIHCWVKSTCLPSTAVCVCVFLVVPFRSFITCLKNYILANPLYITLQRALFQLSSPYSFLPLLKHGCFLEFTFREDHNTCVLKLRFFFLFLFFHFIAQYWGMYFEFVNMVSRAITNPAADT